MIDGAGRDRVQPVGVSQVPTEVLLGPKYPGLKSTSQNIHRVPDLLVVLIRQALNGYVLKNRRPKIQIPKNGITQIKPGYYIFNFVM